MYAAGLLIEGKTTLPVGARCRARPRTISSCLSERFSAIAARMPPAISLLVLVFKDVQHVCGSPKDHPHLAGAIGADSDQSPTGIFDTHPDRISHAERLSRHSSRRAPPASRPASRRPLTRTDDRSGDASRRLPASPQSDGRPKTPAGDQGHPCPARDACGSDGSRRDTSEGCDADDDG
jgi:hypothetical protein